MKRLFLAVAVVTLAAFVVRAQQADKTAQAPETTMDGAKAPAAKKADKSVKKDKKGKAVVEDHTPAASEYGKAAKCPVTGEEFKVSAETKAVKYKGKVYYFCCPSCAPSFKKNPAKFAK
ncbi:MAG: YHS domain-containing protein [Elusimicrobia bacterium]|nr:YHS domain-containing protein [Elusimicrobiota bacterium]